MDRFVIREARTGSVYATGTPSGPQFVQDDESPKTIYLSNAPYGNDYTGVPYNMNAGYGVNMSNMQLGMNAAMVSGPAYLGPQPSTSGYMMRGGEEVIVHNTIPATIIGSEYQNHNYIGPERVIQSYASPSRTFTNNEVNNSFVVPPKKMPSTTFNNSNTMSAHFKQKKNLQFAQQRHSEPEKYVKKHADESQKFESRDADVPQVTKADKIKRLQKTGSRAFSGPIEKVLKWHKSLHDIGVFVFYEIVAKCVNISGEGCAKHLVIRDEGGPAMQVVYYEIDFLLPTLKVPCTIRVLGRIMPGTCRLQAFSVRTATGDDVAILPRRAAVSAHHVSKLCKEYGAN